MFKDTILCTKKRINKKTQQGFSLTELTITLVIFGAIVLVTTKVGYDIAQKKRDNTQATMIKNYEDTVIKYMSDNYDSINNSLSSSGASRYVVNYNYIIGSYSKLGVNEKWDQTSVFGQPCLIFTKDNNSNIKPYLLIPYNTMTSGSRIIPTTLMKNKDIIDVRKSFNSDSMSILEQINPNQINVKTGQSTIFTINPSTDLANCTGFQNLDKINYPNTYKGFLINLSKNPDYVNKITNISDGTDNKGNSEALRSMTTTGINDKTMFSNLYLDAIVKESQAWSTNYCDAGSANSTILTQQCQNFANSNGLRFDGMQQVSSITMTGGTCQIQAKGNFSALTACSRPNNTVQTQALNICQNAHPNGYNYNGNLDVLSFSNTPINGICYANYKANFILNGTQQCHQEAYVEMYNGARPPSVWANQGDDLTNRLIGYPVRGCNANDNQILISFVCGDSKNTFPIQYGITTELTGSNGKIVYAVNSDKKYPQDYGKMFYKTVCNTTPSITQDYQCASNLQYSADYGASSTMNCGSVYNDSAAYKTNTGVNPPEHRFKSLSLGNNGSATVELRSNSQDGVAATDSTLLVKNAAVKSGFIAPKIRTVNPIAADSTCTPAELGKIAQQKDDSTNYTTSQIVCTYSPDFCGGTGYCFAPLKSQTQTITQNNVSAAYCPAGTRADPTQINSSNIGNYVNNSIICGSGLTQKYAMIYDGNKAIGFKSYCVDSYNQTYPLGKITQILCLGAADFHSFSNCKGGSDGKVVCS